MSATQRAALPARPCPFRPGLPSARPEIGVETTPGDGASQYQRCSPSLAAASTACDGRTDGRTDGSVIYRRRRLIPYPGGRRRRRRRDVMFYSSTRQNPRDDRHSDPPARVQLCHSRTIIRRLTMIYRYFMCRAALNSSSRRPGRSSTVY